MMIVDTPRVLKIYLAGYMSGSCLDKCLAWRKQIRDHYGNWKDAGLPYPVTFLDPFNGPEIGTISKDGLKSEVPPKAILMGDYMSVKEADLLIVNWDTFGEKRASVGTPSEMAWAWQLGKPIITIIKDSENMKHHPFIGGFTTIFVESIEELLNSKHINYFYKRVNHANY